MTTTMKKNKLSEKLEKHLKGIKVLNYSQRPNFEVRVSDKFKGYNKPSMKAVSLAKKEGEYKTEKNRSCEIIAKIQNGEITFNKPFPCLNGSTTRPTLREALKVFGVKEVKGFGEVKTKNGTVSNKLKSHLILVK
jgi:hypothetical protein